MDFQNILKHGFNNLFNFEGRDGKQQFLIYYLAVFLTLLTFSAFLFLEDAIDGYEAVESYNDSMADSYRPGLSPDYMIARNEADNERREELQTRAVISGAKFAFVGLLLPFLLTLSSMVRRMHDANYSGKWLLVFVLLIAGFAPAIPILIGCLALLKPDPQPNQFGEPS